LVKADAVETFQKQVAERYRQATGLNTTIYVTRASQGAQRLR
jgi:galactokinase